LTASSLEATAQEAGVNSWATTYIRGVRRDEWMMAARECGDREFKVSKELSENSYKIVVLLLSVKMQ
jgi:hypothetical protein